jgi:hypothetical protein
MSRSFIRMAVAALAIAGLLASSIAEAQWVLLARRVVGRVQSMSQTTKDGTSTFDTAAVILDVPVEKVYATLKSSLERAQATQGITITLEDDAQRYVTFSKGEQSVAIQLAVLGDNLTHLMVSSARPAADARTGTMNGNGEPPPTVIIVDKILAVCKEMNVECFRPAP